MRKWNSELRKRHNLQFGDKKVLILDYILWLLYYFCTGERHFYVMRTINKMLLDGLDAVFKSILVSNSLQGKIMFRREVCEQISKMPAPRLYITPEYALRVARGDARCGANKTITREMHQEVRRRYHALPPNMRSLTGIAKVIAQPAESFYLMPSRISKLLYQVYAKNNRRKQA